MILQKFWILLLQIQWSLEKIDKNLKVQKNLKEPSRFLYMVQVSSQKIYNDIYIVYLHILLVANIG